MASNCVVCKKLNEYVEQPYTCWECVNVWGYQDKPSSLSKEHKLLKRYTPQEWDDMWHTFKGLCKHCGLYAGAHAAGYTYKNGTKDVYIGGACHVKVLATRNIKGTPSLDPFWAIDYIYEE